MVGQEGWCWGGRKCFIRLDRNRVAALVNNIQVLGGFSFVVYERETTRSRNGN